MASRDVVTRDDHILVDSSGVTVAFVELLFNRMVLCLSDTMLSECIETDSYPVFSALRRSLCQSN